jgi:hypothetical protein
MEILFENLFYVLTISSRATMQNVEEIFNKFNVV